MILDTSALLAILLQEPEAEAFAQAIERVGSVRLSVASYLEASIYIDRRADAVRRAMLETFIEEFEIELEPVTVEQIRIARQAFQLFGKGMHPAGLNYGDCFSYALAKSRRERLLYKGDDFSRTDLPLIVGDEMLSGSESV